MVVGKFKARGAGAGHSLMGRGEQTKVLSVVPGMFPQVRGQFPVPAGWAGAGLSLGQTQRRVAMALPVGWLTAVMESAAELLQVAIGVAWTATAGVVPTVAVPAGGAVSVGAAAVCVRSMQIDAAHKWTA